MPHLSRAKLPIISRMPMMIKSTVAESNIIIFAHLDDDAYRYPCDAGNN